jgi:hypothetical protein
MQAIHRNPFQLLDPNDLREALSIFESYNGPQQYAPNPILIRSIQSLLTERRNTQLLDSTVIIHDHSYSEPNQLKHDDDKDICNGEYLNVLHQQEALGEVDHDASMMIRKYQEEEITPEHQRINDHNDRNTSTDDYNIKVESQSKTPNDNMMVQRNSSGGRAWLSSTKAPRSRRKKSYTNRKKKPRNVSFGAVESTNSHGRIPSSITIDMHGDGDDNSFAFHSQSSMTDDF